MYTLVFCLVTAVPAAEDILRVDDVTPAIERLVALRSAHQLEAAGRAAEALATLAPFDQGDDPLAVAIQFHAARLRLVLGETGGPRLVAFLLRPAGEVRWGISRRQEADAMQLLAHRLRQAGRQVDAAAVQRRAALEYPRWVAAPNDLDRKLRRERADNLIRDMDYEGGLAELEGLLESATHRAEKRKLQRAIGHLIGDKMRENYTRVRDIYRVIADQRDATIDDLFYLAYATGKVDPRAAVEVYREIINRFPEHHDVDEARFFIAWTAFDLEDLEQAVRNFDKFLDETPSSGYRFAVRWYRGLATFRLGRYRRALDDFELTARTNSNRAKGRYWSARALRKLGQRADADEILYGLAERHPFSYYGLLARALLARGERPPVFDVSTEPRDEGLDETTAHAALDQLSEHSRALVTEAYAADQMGWPGLAAATLAHIEELRSKRNAPLRAWLQHRLGVAHRAVRSQEARRCRAALDEEPSVDHVEACWRKVYPTPFAQVIDEVRGQLPSSVFWSIMRQESYYKPTARSHADALGLMQLIPQVGGPAAVALGRTFAPYELYQPETNLRLFALAAHERVRRFAGHVPLILMSYNATPEKTEHWLRDNRDLPFDLFVEEIPWSETRGYVKHISTNLARYETLLGADAELLTRAHLPHPEAVVAEVFGDVFVETELASAD